MLLALEANLRFVFISSKSFVAQHRLKSAAVEVW